MDSITIDGMEEMEFRRGIEAMLRRGHADDAAQKLRNLLEGYAGEGRILPERFLSVTSEDVRLDGWEGLAGKLGEYDRPEVAMSAISIDILDPQGVGVQPNEEGRLKPVMETSYFSDSAYPFSQADREDLLDGYSSFGCEWQGNFENVDTTISVEGIDDLYGAAVALENKVANGSNSAIEDIQAGSVGSCYIAVLIHQAIRNAVRDKGLPRPICVLAGSNDAYPFFDAPAMTIEEYCKQGGVMPLEENAATALSDDEFGEAGPAAVDGMGSLESLVGLGAKKKEKKPVLVIDPTEADTAESLEMPILEEVIADGRQHIMPSIELEAEQLPEGAQAPQWDAVPDPAEPGTPDDFGMEEIAASQAEQAWEPAPPAEFDEQETPTRMDFGSGGMQLSSDGPAPEHPTPIDFTAFEQSSPDRFGEEEPPAPLERLTREPVQPQLPESHPDVFARDGDEAMHELPGSGFAEADPEPELAGYADFEIGAHDHEPLDLEGFALHEEPSLEEWALADDLPTGHETGDNPGFSAYQGTGFETPAPDEPRPARHAIRVIAASVTNEGNARSARRKAPGPSLVLRLILGIAAIVGKLRDLIARR